MTSYVVSFIMGLGQVLNNRTVKSESLTKLQESLKQSRHLCLYCETVFSDPQDQEDPVCKSCHLFSVYAQDYYDTFLCKCQVSQLHCQHPCPYFSDKETMSSQVNTCKCQSPNWTFPTKLAESLKKSNYQDPCDLQREETNSLTTLPPEIICMILSNLDEITLMRARKVCKNWEHLVNYIHPNWKWKSLLSDRWPLFKSATVSEPVSWLSVYFKMLESAPCTTCLWNSTGHSKLPEPNFHNEEGDGTCSRLKRLDQEFISLGAIEIKGVEAMPLDGQKYDWMTRLVGPCESPYEGGIFYINIKFPVNYPFQPPKVRFLTKIFHPDISRHGDVDILDLISPRFWSPGHTMRSLLVNIQSLLVEPRLKSQVEPLIKKLFIQDRATFTNIARKWTNDYAVNFES